MKHFSLWTVVVFFVVQGCGKKEEKKGELEETREEAREARIKEKKGGRDEDAKDPAL